MAITILWQIDPPKFEYAALDKVSRSYFIENFNIDEAAVKAAWSAL